MKQGFTLLELSIVLVIIGLIIGGITAGADLIRAAQLNSVVSDYRKYQTAVKTFELKYNQLPGDMDNATAYWGTAADCRAAAAGTATCDGDGSGKLAYVFSGDTSGVQHEPWHFWKHLSNAEIISGNFSGFSDNSQCSIANFCMELGVNAPKGSIEGAGWFATSAHTTTKQFQGRATNQNRNTFYFTNPSNNSNLWWGASISAVEQYQIDEKMDDGMPYTGKLVDMSGIPTANTRNCASASSNEFASDPPGVTTVGATYLLDKTTISATEGCIAIFDME